jgi:hypothetical protein
MVQALGVSPPLRELSCRARAGGALRLGRHGDRSPCSFGSLAALGEVSSTLLRLNERTARAVQAIAAGRERGVLFERHDRRPTRHGHQALPIPYTQRAVSRLLVELAGAAGLLGADHGEVDRCIPPPAQAHVLDFLPTADAVGIPGLRMS